MWQQDPFQAEGRRFNLEATTARFSTSTQQQQQQHIASSGKLSTLSSAAALTPDLCGCWQRSASLVQSPASEGSATSTPDQCPPSPAVTLREMPSSRNGSCNNVIMPREKQHQHQQQHWEFFSPQQVSSAQPQQQLFPASSMELDCGNWSSSNMTAAANALLASSSTSSDKYNAAGKSQQHGWSSILSDSSKMCTTAASFMLEGLNEALVSRAEFLPDRHEEAVFRSSAPSSCPPTSDTVALAPPISSAATAAPPLYAAANAPPAVVRMVKREPEQFLQSTACSSDMPLVLDDKAFSSLHKSGFQERSRIGNFIDLLRQSDQPVSDASAAASCNHLSQLISSSSQDAAGMWIARSSRLPAMLSEVLPSPGSTKPAEAMDSRKRRPAAAAAECRVVDSNNQERGQCQESPSLLSPKQQQEADEAVKDRVANLGVTTTNDDITSELFSKRPRIENSNSFPFKMQVRKEKLGERISALQQLVSPFGKTDTASVLLEAIGYIKFLHEQVQVLSSPYMKHTSNSRHNDHGKFCWGSSDKDGDEAKQDLRSRGLCLVPISCTLQVANDNGADYWTPTLHGGLK